MKLEKGLKLYYSEKIRTIGQLTIPQSVVDQNLFPVRAKKQSSDLMINVALHFFIVMVIIGGLHSFSNSSALSDRLSERAEEIALNDIVEHKILQMSSGIKYLRKNY